MPEVKPPVPGPVRLPEIEPRRPGVVPMPEVLGDCDRDGVLVIPGR
jgi:hypothetical protein